MLLSPGTNFAIKSALAPRRAKVSSPLSDTRVRLDREPTHPLEDPMPTDAPDLVPDEVAEHRACERQRRREPQAEVAGPGQGAGTEEEGLSRHRWHELLDDHAAKEGRIAVDANEDFQAFHSESPRAPYFLMNSTVIAQPLPKPAASRRTTQSPR